MNEQHYIRGLEEYGSLLVRTKLHKTMMENFLNSRTLHPKHEAEINILIKEQEDNIKAIKIQMGCLRRKLIMVRATMSSN